ncbi:MAG TPA: hypothetical protein DEP23_08000 [Ruminococcaceae bacterium]|nr:hypothetical protein [Oscillospiraceae bacterium]
MKQFTETCVFCGQIVPGRKPTNADRIRAMSDEELAVTIMCPNEIGMAEIPCDHGDDKNCCQCCLDWLNQEAAQEEPAQEVT